MQGLSFADTHTGTSGTVKLAKKDSATAPTAKKPAAKACLPHHYQCSHANATCTEAHYYQEQNFYEAQNYQSYN